jgi:hypothetical protein
MGVSLCRQRVCSLDNSLLPYFAACRHPPCDVSCEVAIARVSARPMLVILTGRRIAGMIATRAVRQRRLPFVMRQAIALASSLRPVAAYGLPTGALLD